MVLLHSGVDETMTKFEREALEKLDKIIELLERRAPWEKAYTYSVPNSDVPNQWPHDVDTSDGK